MCFLQHYIIYTEWFFETEVWYKNRIRASFRIAAAWKSVSKLIRPNAIDFLIVAMKSAVVEFCALKTQTWNVGGLMIMLTRLFKNGLAFDKKLNQMRH